MIVLDVFYVALATIAILVILQLVTFGVTRIMYPPEPKIIYQQVPIYQPPPPAQQQPLFPNATQPPALTQQQQEVQLPEYEPRKPTTTSLRLDPELPPGLQETRPSGT